MNHFDLTIIGGGLVGLATACQFLETHPGKCVVVLEKERAVATHQSGRNSGVIHSGIYYKPGSLKAKNCLRGRVLLEQFCRAQEVPFRLCGKVIVATSPEEVRYLDILMQRGTENQLRCRLLSSGELTEFEPHVNGLAAIHVPETGVVDFKALSQRLTQLITERGSMVVTNSEVKTIKCLSDSVEISTQWDEFRSPRAVNCAGLYSDVVAKLAGAKLQCAIVPFRGEYYLLKSERASLCRNLIYPVPDPRFPFLGVHFTRGVDNTVECGPNAVLAFAREGYTLGAVNFRELGATLNYAGFRSFIKKHWRTGLSELYRSISKTAFTTALQRLVPEVKESDLISAPSGVRAQAINSDGTIVDDFLIERTGPMLHVLNAPSPAATSCLSIGEQLVEML